MALQQIGLDAVLNNVPDFTAGINKMNAGVDSFAKNSKDAGKDFGGGFGEIVTGALRQIGTLAVDALLKAGQAVAGFVKDSIGLAGDFQANMLEFQSVAGKDVDTKGLEEFHDLFLQIGKDLPVSTSDVQQAAIEMVKGGIDPATIAAGGLKQNIQFAAAAMSGDLVKAAEISSKIMGGWAGVGATAAEKADFLTHATDLLAKAANASSTDVEGLSRGIFNAQGIARTAGVSFDDLTTTLAALAPRFASSSEAGNSLKNMIVRLQPTTDPATEAMTRLGLYTEETGSAFYDAQGNFVGFQQASELLKQSLVGLTKEQQAATLQQIFGNDAMGSAAALAELGAVGYQEMADSLLNANGVMDAAALKQAGFNTSLDNAKGSVEALQITLGEKLLPILGDVLDNYIAPFVNSLTDLAAAVFGDEEAFNKLSPAMQDVAKTIQQLGDDIAYGIGVVEDIADEVQALIGTFNQAGGASDQLGSAVDDLSGVWDVALTVVQNVMAGYQAIAQAVLPIVAGFIDEHGAEIESFFKTTWDTIIDIVTLALQLYDAIVPPILQAIAGFIDDHGSEIQKILGGAWDMISSLITGVLETIKGVISLALHVIQGDWEGAWEDIKGIGKAQWDAITGIITGALDIVAGLFDTSMSDILGVWEDNWNSMLSLVEDVGWLEAGNMVVAGIKQGIADAWDSLMGWFSDKVAGLVDAAMDAIGAASPATKFMPVGQYAVEGIMQGFSDTWPSLMDQVSDLSDDLIGSLSDLGAQVQGIIADGFGATASIDRQMAKNLEQIGKIEDAFTQKVVTQDLETLRKKAMDLFPDPQVAAKYYKMVSDHEFEILALRKKIAEASTQEEKDRLGQQLILISRAQEAELDQFYAAQKGQGNPYQDLIDTIQQLMKDGLPINDSGFGHELMLLLNKLNGIPGFAAGGAVSAGGPVWVGEQGPELFWPNMAGRIQSQPSMRAGASGGNSTSYSHAQTVNMPIYTSYSPSVLQDSMAIAGAALL